MEKSFDTAGGRLACWLRQCLLVSSSGIVLGVSEGLMSDGGGLFEPTAGQAKSLTEVLAVAP